MKKGIIKLFYFLLTNLSVHDDMLRYMKMKCFFYLADYSNIIKTSSEEYHNDVLDNLHNIYLSLANYKLSQYSNAINYANKINDNKINL